MTKLLKVTLRVCPTCERVSPLPDGSWAGKQTCGGPKEAPHKRTRMTPRTFVEKGSRS